MDIQVHKGQGQLQHVIDIGPHRLLGRRAQGFAPVPAETELIPLPVLAGRPVRYS
jgi:hypothetical protein